MNIKKVLALLLTFIFVISAFSACGDKKEKASDSKTTTNNKENDNSYDASADVETDNTVIRIGGLKGPTTMGLVKLMEDSDNNTSACNYSFTVEGTADALTPLLIQGKLDMAAIPANLASVLYNKTNGEIQVLGINTLGVLYIVERGLSIESIADLKNKTIYATGKGTTPEYSLRYILSKNGLDPDKDVNLVWKTEATEVVGQLANTEGAVAMLPQPYVTVAKTKVQDLEVVLNLNDEWSAVSDGQGMVTGVTVVRKEFAEAHPDLIQSFLDEYKMSIDYIVEHPTEASTLVEKRIDVKAAIAEKAIPNCNITLVTRDDMKTMVKAYLEALYEQSPQAVGGALPGEDFYYEF